MTSVYAMQRANGDWFALDDYGRLRVPVFRSPNDAMEARSRHPGMLLFKPVVLDERALNDLAPTGEEDSAGYWMVSNPLIKLRRGRPLEHEQLVLLVNEAAQPSEE
ncbi:MAG: hypothetical protein M3362_28075 [Acidobacteriota bacterium]|nr:hypothetical protein [Acidobacteriota bacterium]